MVLNFNLNEFSILISGINAVVSVFLLVVSMKALRKGLRIVRYLAAFFGLVFIDSLSIVASNFGIAFLENYTSLMLELTALIVMLLFYVGMIRGKKS
ncbi:MAG: hypothetical protein M1597_02435 [Candidatus Thermoplasmatota archaeon]|nr:hypothetical protein [Candidatus Thermoplasmatota archaeon]